MSKTQEAQTGSQDMVAKLLAQSKSGSHSEAWPDLRWWDHGSPSGWEELALPLVKAVLGARFTDCLLCAQHCTGLRRRVASEEEEDRSALASMGKFLNSAKLLFAHLGNTRMNFRYGTPSPKYEAYHTNSRCSINGGLC